MTRTFDHEAYLKHVPLNAPLRFRVPAFSQNCEASIMPPAANRELCICRECRSMPEYRELVAGD